jgi:hypothetical protein
MKLVFNIFIYGESSAQVNYTTNNPYLISVIYNLQIYDLGSLKSSAKLPK